MLFCHGFNDNIKMHCTSKIKTMGLMGYPIRIVYFYDSQQYLVVIFNNYFYYKISTHGFFHSYERFEVFNIGRCNYLSLFKTSALNQ